MRLSLHIDWPINYDCNTFVIFSLRPLIRFIRFTDVIVHENTIFIPYTVCNGERVRRVVGFAVEFSRLIARRFRCVS